jgi:hypothetical protein
MSETIVEASDEIANDERQNEMIQNDGYAKANNCR